MDFETDAMTSAMDEELAKSRILDHTACRSVDLLTRNFRSDRGTSGFIGGQNDSMNFLLLFRRFTNGESAS
jgi:hypothetical protein